MIYHVDLKLFRKGFFLNYLFFKSDYFSETVQYLIDNIDRTLQQSIEIEEKLSIDLIENLSEIKEDILQRLQHLKNVPNRLENPNIYHLDVGAMYPNIILTNRLQPSAIVDSTICAQCDLNRPNARCQRKMDWIWRGTYVPATRNELQRIQLQLENERFSFNGQTIEKKTFTDGSKKGRILILESNIFFSYA